MERRAEISLTGSTYVVTLWWRSNYVEMWRNCPLNFKSAPDAFNCMERFMAVPADATEILPGFTLELQQ